MADIPAPAPVPYAPGTYHVTFKLPQNSHAFYHPNVCVFFFFLFFSFFPFNPQMNHSHKYNPEYRRLYLFFMTFRLPPNRPIAARLTTLKHTSGVPLAPGF